MTDYLLTELTRKLANLLRVGTIELVDAREARAKVRCGDIVTTWLPWFSRRAGNDREWWAPEKGEQVLLISPDGEMSQGLILPGLYQNAHPAPSQSQDVFYREFSDGATIEYDRAAHVLKTNIPGDVHITAKGTISATAGEKITLTAQQIELNGQTFINGALSQGGGYNGGSARFNGALHAVDTITSDADIIADRISLKHHLHGCPHGGNTTEPVE